jgi:hypothetical protein
MRRLPVNEGYVKADTFMALRTAEIKASFGNIGILEVRSVIEKECVVDD